MQSKRRRIQFLFLLLVLPAMIGFASGQTENGKSSSGGSPKSVNLSVWYLSQSQSEIGLIQSLDKKYESAHPGVSITFTPYTFADMQKSLTLAMNSGTGPDVAYTGSKKPFVAAYGPAGTLVDLTPIAEKEGWTKEISPSLIKLANINTEGDTIWGMPFDAAAVGVFYNQSIFDKLGLTVPKTFSDFQNILAKVKQAGITPFSLGAQSGWPTAHYFNALVTATAPIDEIQPLALPFGGGSYTTPGFVKAMTILKDWMDNGYINEHFLGTNYEEQKSMFETGKVAMTITGTWANSEFNENSNFKVRFFPMPRINPDIPWHMAGYQQNNLWIIPKYTKKREEAIQYISYMLGGEVAKALWDSGDLPAYQFKTVPASTSELQSDVYKAMQDTGIGFFLGSTPKVANEQNAALQEMGAGSLTAQQALDKIEAVYKQSLQN